MSARCAIVTGATRGIGRRSAEALAERGFPVALCGRTASAVSAVADELTERYGVATYGQAVELRDLDAARRFIDAAREHLGPVAVLVNNAAELGPVGALHRVDPVAWAATLHLDVAVVAALSAACLPDMLDAGWGRIVNMAGGGVGGPSMAVGVSAYTTSKLAVCGLTEALGNELDGTGVVVVALAPGTIGTGFMAGAIDAAGFPGADRLRAMAEAQRDRPDDVVPFLRLLGHVVDTECGELTGRTLSARWETPEALDALVSAGPLRPARFRLRRVDEVLYREDPDAR